jgi:hypothetical protein
MCSRHSLGSRGQQLKGRKRQRNITKMSTGEVKIVYYKIFNIKASCKRKTGQKGGKMEN